MSRVLFNAKSVKRSVAFGVGLMLGVQAVQVRGKTMYRAVGSHRTFSQPSEAQSYADAIASRKNGVVIEPPAKVNAADDGAPSIAGVKHFDSYGNPIKLRDYTDADSRWWAEETASSTTVKPIVKCYACEDHAAPKKGELCTRCEAERAAAWEHSASEFEAYTKGYQAGLNDALQSIDRALMTA